MFEQRNRQVLPTSSAVMLRRIGEWAAMWSRILVKPSTPDADRVRIGPALIALTPISPFRPRRWRGAILPDKARITLRVLEPDKRPVSAVADQREVRDVAQVDVAVDRVRDLTLLFDPEHALDYRITMEQFAG